MRLQGFPKTSVMFSAGKSLRLRLIGPTMHTVEFQFRLTLRTPGSTEPTRSMSNLNMLPCASTESCDNLCTALIELSFEVCSAKFGMLWSTIFVQILKSGSPLHLQSWVRGPSENSHGLPGRKHLTQHISTR
jgi:hypothetical protein